MEINTVQELNNNGRKYRECRKKRKLKEYLDKDPLGIDYRVPCQHKSIKSKFSCSSLSVQEILNNRRKLYKNKLKVNQDRYLCRLMTTYEPVRRNKIPLKNTKPRKVNCNYYLLSRKLKAVHVCKKLFMTALGVSEKRLRSINHTTIKGEIPKENRGGDHRSHRLVEKKNKLREFLNNLPAQESHYNRKKSKRIYLSSELYTSKLLKLYNDSVTADLKIKPRMFYQIFNYEYNIGFRKPSSDACNMCTLLSNQIKSEKNAEKRSQFIIQKRVPVHTMRANAFYALLKSDVPNSITLCFDLQQVLPLPETPIQDSFYSRQISLYNFCIYNSTAKKANFYIWDETEGNRGVTEIGSALYDYVNKLQFLDNVITLRLFCDGCGAQNKNSFIVHLLIQWLYSKSPIQLKEIQLHFPVRGHSFLPADRVFGRIEKDLRRHAVTTKKEDYVEIIKKHGNVNTIEANDWEMMNIKELSNNFKKVDKIQNLKRIYILKTINKKTKKVLKCEMVGYENLKLQTDTEVPVSLLKLGKRIPKEISTKMKMFIPLTANKKKDVYNLLVKQFGDEWRNLDMLSWYKKNLDDNPALQDGQQAAFLHDHGEHDLECDCNEPEDLINLRV